ncbi:hypothetical protein D3C72_2156800 [compost metagenome]
MASKAGTAMCSVGHDVLDEGIGHAATGEIGHHDQDACAGENAVGETSEHGEAVTFEHVIESCLGQGRSKRQVVFDELHIEREQAGQVALLQRPHLDRLRHDVSRPSCRTCA